MEVLQKRTEDSRLFANPTGTFSTENFAQPIHVRKGETWVDIDPTLQVNPDGTISPIATPGELKISAGGSGPLVTVSKGSKSLSLTWPTPLPTPSLLGSTAIYANVLPDVDLQVIADPAGGYHERLVVKTPAAAANPALNSITFGVTTTGLTLSARPDGGVNAVDSSGTGVFATDTPLMWDTPVAPTLTKLERIEGLTREDPQPKYIAPMDVQLSPGAMTVIPDQALLSNPDVQWPLYLDPSSTPIASYDWTHISKNYPTQSYWNYDRDDGAKVGLGEGVTYRSYFLFSIAAIRGKIVTKATFAITLNHSYQCTTSTPVDLYHTDNISRSASVTWKNSVTDTNKWRTKLATASGHANGSSCGEPDMPMDFASTALTNAVSAAAGGTSNQLTFGLRAPDEGTTQQWKKFHPQTAKLTVEWNTAPGVPTELTTYPPTPCGSVTNPARLPESMKTPTFTAGLSDADANNLTGYLEIRKTADDSVVYGPVVSATIPAGGVITWPTLPSTALGLNTNYYYQARARDTGGAYGPYTGKCHFIIDATDPGTPTISSTDYPDGAEGIAAGTIGTVTINPAVGDDDIAGYRYGFDDTVSLWVPADDTGNATVPITLWTNPSRPRPPTANLWVKAVDKAGNERAEVTGPRTLTASVSANTVANMQGDVNGDGKADVTAVLDMGDGRTAAWTFLSSTSAFHAPVINWDSGINGRHAAGSIKTVTGDFDNDGRTDTAMFRQDRDGQVRLFNLRSDTNQFRADWPELAAGTWLLGDARVLAGDFNGDGIDDAAAIVNDRAGGWTTYVYTSTGTSFSPAATWYAQPAGTYTWSNTRTLAGDFNGDGKTDIAVAQDSTGTRTTLRVHTSTGSTFDAGSQWWDSDTDTDPEAYVGSAAKYAVANLDGTAADDIIAMYNHGAKTTIKVLTAAGSTFATPTTWWDSDTGSSDGWDWRRTVQFSTGDFDGNGSIDLAAIVDCCQAGNRELWTFPNTGTGFGQATIRGNATATTARPATAHWRIDEGNGTVLADAGDSYPASLSGPAWNNNGHVVGTKALQFDGTNDYATAGRSIVETSRSYSVAAWVKLDNTTTYQTIASQDGQHLSAFYLQYSKAFNSWAFVVPSADSTGTVSYWAAKDTIAPRLGVWTHLVGVYDADAQQLKLYVNGVLRGASSRPDAWSGTGPFQIGKAFSAPATSGNWWTGGIDDVQVYDVALNGTEAGQIARETTPAGHWKFDAASGPNIDASGNNRNLTLVGATTGAPGKNGEGLTFNGTGSYATAPNAINTTTGYTVCAWAKLDNVANLTYRAVVSQEGTRSSGFWLRTSPSNKWEFDISYADNVYSSVESTTVVAADTWTHVCGSWDAGTSQMMLFVNGNLEGAKVVPAGIVATGPVSIGRYKYMDTQGSFFAGVIDDVQVFSGTILDPAKIRVIMNGS
ncbi:hypothetical protein GCM10027290_46360 [Micromonospora sonneratiae]